MRNMADQIVPENISTATGISVYDVNEALIYWKQAGILLCKEEKVPAEPNKTQVVKRNQKPTRSDVARRGLEDPKIQFLMQEAQLRLGRNLKSNETNTLVWLYDDHGLDVSLILMIIQYAVDHNKANIRFVESTAVNWVNKGIDNIVDADVELKKLAMGEQAWGMVCRAFGIERRKPSQKETELALLWVDEWKMSMEMLIAAYEACVDAKSKFTMAYTAKILETWHKNGWNKPSDIQREEKSKDEGYAAYDLDLFEKMLNTKD
jgi:DnaD/phage-associated family protein